MMVSDRIDENETSPERFSSALKAKAVVRKLSGESNAVLVRASDGLLYVIKMMDGLKGPNVLANEALGNELGKYLGLSVPDWRPIELSEAFIEKYLLMHWTGSESWLDRPGPGLYFGSLAVGQDDHESVLKELPENWHSRIVNRKDFVGMLLLDLWANQIGPRNAILVNSCDQTKVTAIFIDNSRMFGGFWGIEEQRRGIALFHDRRVYADLDVNRIFNGWLQKAIAMDEKMLLQLATVVPSQWHDGGYLQDVSTQLQIRKWRVAQMLSQELAIVANGKNNAASPISVPSDTATDRLETSAASIAEDENPDEAWPDSGE
jgi:hypothetical protein